MLWGSAKAPQAGCEVEPGFLGRGESVNITVWSESWRSEGLTELRSEELITKPSQRSLATRVSLFKGLQLGGEDVILTAVSSSGIWLFLLFGGGSLTPPSPTAQGTRGASPHLWLCLHSCSRQHFRLWPVGGTCSVDEGYTWDQVRRKPSSPLPSPWRKEGDVSGLESPWWGRTKMRSWLRWGSRAQRHLEGKLCRLL